MTRVAESFLLLIRLRECAGNSAETPQGGQVGTKRLRLLGKAELLPAETRSLGDHLPVTSVSTSSVTLVPPLKEQSLCF